MNLCGYTGVRAKELRRVGIEIPGLETERFVKLAKELDCYIMPGSWLERDPELITKNELTISEMEEIERRSHEAFYSKYYGEKVKFPSCGKAFWGKLGC